MVTAVCLIKTIGSSESGSEKDEKALILTEESDSMTLICSLSVQQIIRASSRTAAGLADLQPDHQIPTALLVIALYLLFVTLSELTV